MILEKIVKTIKSVIHKGTKIFPEKIELVTILSKFSSTKKPTVKIKINDNIILDRNDKLTYECIGCHNQIEILVGKFITKESENCRTCKEKDIHKREKQSDYVKKSFQDYGKVVRTNKNILKFNELTKIQLIKLSEELFSQESLEFKSDYLDKTISEEEFNSIKLFIVKIDDENISDSTKIKYFRFIKNTNQTKYSSKVLINDKFHLLDKCEFICQLCNEKFTGRNIIDKYKNGILCKQCSFSNKTFSFKYFFNVHGEKVIYQSNPELKLLKYFNELGIIIKNGPRLRYTFDGKERIYKVDFEIPNLKKLIEVKDMHIWHKRELESGKWQAKESSAIKWSQENDYKFYLIHDVDKIINQKNNPFDDFS